MFRFKIGTALVALTALAVPASALATNVTVWSIQQPPTASNNDQAPYAGVGTILDDPYVPPPTGNQATVPEELAAGGNAFGMGIVWCAVGAVGDGNTTGPQVACDGPVDEWKFIREPGTYVTRQITASDRVALYNTQVERYVAEGHQTFGINLVWTKTPRYQWQVAKGGDSGHPTLADLYNDTEKAYLINHGRSFGPDLGWIHAPFYTGPDYIPPTVSRQPPPVNRPPAK